MQFRELRRALQAIVLAGLPACGVTDVITETECSRTLGKHFEVATPADPPIQLRIESCRAASTPAWSCVRC